MKRHYNLRMQIVGDREQRNTYKRIVAKAAHDVERFFVSYKVPHDVKVCICKNRNLFNQQVGRKTLDWLVAVTNRRTISILNPDALEAESTHKKSEFARILIHELCHVVISDINEHPLQWLDEGIALCVAKQKKPQRINRRSYHFFLNEGNLRKNLPLHIFADHEGYVVGYWLVRYLLNQVSKEEIMQLLQIDVQRDCVAEAVEKIIGSDIRETFKKINWSLPAA